MNCFTHSHKSTYTVSEYLKIHHQYFNHAKAKHCMLLSKSVKGWPIKGSGVYIIGYTYTSN